MSRFYSEAYKWSLYEKYRTGFSLTEICEISGVTDKPLREWFRHFDLQYSRASSMSLKEVNRKSAQLTKQFEKAQAELRLFRSGSVFVEVPESIRISCAQPLLKRYGPNLVCRLLKIRKSNLYYHILRRPDMTVYESEKCWNCFEKFLLGWSLHRGKANIRSIGRAIVQTYSPGDFPSQDRIWLGSAISQPFKQIPANTTSVSCWTCSLEESLRHVFLNRRTLLS